MAHAHTKKILTRLARISGHVEGIQKMIEAERPCPDVIMQIVAVRSSLNKVAHLIVADHMEHCLVEAAKTGEIEAELANLRAALDLLL